MLVCIDQAVLWPLLIVELCAKGLHLQHPAFAASRNRLAKYIDGLDAQSQETVVRIFAIQDSNLVRKGMSSGRKGPRQISFVC